MIGASIHHGNATRASIRATTGSGTAESPYVVRDVLRDNNGSSSYQPHRYFDTAETVVLGETELAAECDFFQPNSYAMQGGFGPLEDFEYCFGVITYTPASSLAKCMSVPQEINMEVAYGFTLNNYMDADTTEERRKKRHAPLRHKRQSSGLIDGFFERATSDGTVQTTLMNVANAIYAQESGELKRNTNAAVLAGKQFPICVKWDEGLVSLPAAPSALGTPATRSDSPPARPGSESCSTDFSTPAPQNEVLSNGEDTTTTTKAPSDDGGSDSGQTGGDSGQTGGDSGQTGGDSGQTGGDSGQTGGDSGQTGGSSDSGSEQTGRNTDTNDSNDSNDSTENTNNSLGEAILNEAKEQLDKKIDSFFGKNGAAHLALSMSVALLWAAYMVLVQH